MVAVYDNNPGYIELHDVVYNPHRRFLVNLRGEAIPETALLRGKALTITDRQRGRADANYESIKQNPVVWIGHVSNTFGHALTEGISRLWFLYRYPEVCAGADIIYQTKGLSRIFKILETYEPRVSQFKKLYRPTLLKHAIVPLPTFCNRALAYTDHLILPESIGLCVEKTSYDRGLLYLSRSQLSSDKRQIFGEYEVERMVTDRGGTVFHPQTESFEKQVEMINSHDTVVGFIGSAFHINLFRVVGRPLFQHVFTHGMVSNYKIIDALKGFTATSKYYKVCSRDSACGKHKTKQNVICRLDHVKRIIDEI